MKLKEMKMEIIEDYEDLEGKTIAFAHFAQFADKFTIATTDGSIFMATMDEDWEKGDKEIGVYSRGQVERDLSFDPWMRNELAKRGLFDLEAYRKRIKAEQERAREEYKKKQEEKELQELERLKKKYESN